MSATPPESVRLGTLAKLLRAPFRAHPDKRAYAFDKSVDWRVCPIDIRLRNGTFQKTLQVETQSSHVVEVDVALGIDMGANYPHLVDRNFHVDLLNSKSFRSQLEVIDTEVDCRSMTRLPPEACESVLSEEAGRRVGLWSFSAGRQEVLLDTVTLLEHFVAIDPFTAALLLSPLMSSGYEVLVSQGRFLFRGDSLFIGDFLDLRSPQYPVSQYHRAKCLAFWLGCGETDEVLRACRSSVISQTEPIQLPVVDHALPARLTCGRVGDHLLALHVQPLLYGGAWPRRFERIRLEDERSGVGMDFWEDSSGHSQQSLAWWGPSRVESGLVTSRSYGIPGSQQSLSGSAALVQLDPVVQFAPMPVLQDWTYTDIILRERILHWQSLGDRSADTSEPDQTLLHDRASHAAAVAMLLRGVLASQISRHVSLYLDHADAYVREINNDLERCGCQTDGAERHAFRAALERDESLFEQARSGTSIEAVEQAILDAFVVDGFLALNSRPQPEAETNNITVAASEHGRLSPPYIDAARILLLAPAVARLFPVDTWRLVRLMVLAQLLGATSMSLTDLRDCFAPTGPYLPNDDLCCLYLDVFGQE